LAATGTAKSGGEPAYSESELLAGVDTALGRESSNAVLSCVERMLDYGLSKLVFTILDTPGLLERVGCTSMV